MADNVLGTLFQDIADAIREKNGDAATMKPAEFPDEIRAIETGGGSGGSLPAGLYYVQDTMPLPNNYYQRWVEMDGVIYAFARNTAGNGDIMNAYKYSDGAWVLLVEAYTLRSWGGVPVVYNGKIHFVGGETTYHIVFDGTAFSALSALPNSATYKSLFIQDDTLKMYSYYDGGVYVWDEASDSWTHEATPGSKHNYMEFFNIDGVIYALRGKNVYRYEGGTVTQLTTLSKTMASSASIVYGGALYCKEVNDLAGALLYKYDPVNNVEHMVGKLPPMNAKIYLTHVDEHLRMVGADTEYYNLILHEVEEGT